LKRKNFMQDTVQSPFPETADIETSSDAYATRFDGPAGRWMLEVQTRILSSLFGKGTGGSILDVGGGHGQTAIPLMEAGWQVTVAASAPECVARLQPHVLRNRMGFKVCDLLHMPFPDRSFDGVVNIRFLPHCTRWRDFVAELCRVAKGRVVVDYPTRRSLNVFSSALFGLKRRVEGNTRPYALFRHDEVPAEFRKHGLRMMTSVPEFFLPMVCHRMMNRRAVSAALEGAFRAIGLTGLLGSPVMACFERQA